MIQVTSSAVQHLNDLLVAEKASPGTGLRLQVEKGGCAGMQYAMRLDGQQSGDLVIEAGDTRVFVDAESLTFLQDSTLDYVESLNDSGFKLINPNAKRTCGCGTSFES
jgi:iron-sulfur cluster assembly protein